MVILDVVHVDHVIDDSLKTDLRGSSTLIKNIVYRIEKVREINGSQD
jgi:hypothetical protein